MGGFGGNRPIISANGSPRQRQDDQRLTQCKICPEAILMSQPRIWASRVEPSKRSGLVHVECATKTGATTVGEAITGGQRKYRT